MHVWAKLTGKTLSVRISRMIVFSVATLLTTALVVMLLYSRQVLKTEAQQNAEQTLEGTVRQIDNILLSVEQASGNIYWDMLMHLDEPERMWAYATALLESNPYITGCAIAFEPYYYEKYGQYFMRYVHRTRGNSVEKNSSPVIQAETFGNVPYLEQVWYSKPVTTGRPSWIDPLKEEEAEGHAITTFSLPIYNRQGKVVGVLASDVALAQLTKVVLAAKPSPNSYATLLGSNGSYIVHPDSDKLFHQTAFTQAAYQNEASVQEATRAMMAGETGCKKFTQNGVENYVFYKPFLFSNVTGRAVRDPGWSIGIVYPEQDIFGDYYQLLYIVIVISVVGLLLLLVGCYTIIHRQLLPLRMLAKSAHRIAEGYYNDPIPMSRQLDEVGTLQNHFLQMQQALSTHVGELESLMTNLRERGRELKKTYENAKEADSLKTAFLHNMTNQMVSPVNTIADRVNTLCEKCQGQGVENTEQIAGDIEEQSKKVIELLDNLLVVSQEEAKKGNRQS